MTVYRLEAYSTDLRSDDVRYRAYTTSVRKAEAFSRIPKIQFTDSGHGIVFSAWPMSAGELRKPPVRAVEDYVLAQLDLIKAREKIT